MCRLCLSFFFNDNGSHRYLHSSLHDALPISEPKPAPRSRGALVADYLRASGSADEFAAALDARRDDYGPFSLLDRKSTRLNSSHLGISYAVFCLKKKKRTNHT